VTLEFSTQVLEKAKKFSDEDVRQDPTYSTVWWVQGSAEYPYRVQIGLVGWSIQYVTCTCPHGLKQGVGEASCSHVAAVLMRLRERVEGETNE
jgi:uncharacterized Zn finger protein